MTPIMIRVAVVACAALAASVSPARAQCSTACNGPNSAGPETLDIAGNEPEKLTTLMSFRYGYAGNFQRESHELPVTGDRFGYGTLTLGADYRASPPLVVRLRLPLTWQKLRLVDSGIYSQSGLGDVELSASLDLTRSPTWLATFGLGSTIPTGDRPRSRSSAWTFRRHFNWAPAPSTRS